MIRLLLFINEFNFVTLQNELTYVNRIKQYVKSKNSICHYGDVSLSGGNKYGFGSE